MAETSTTTSTYGPRKYTHYRNDLHFHRCAMSRERQPKKNSRNRGRTFTLLYLLWLSRSISNLWSRQRHSSLSWCHRDQWFYRPTTGGRHKGRKMKFNARTSELDFANAKIERILTLKINKNIRSQIFKLLLCLFKIPLPRCLVFEDTILSLVINGQFQTRIHANFFFAICIVLREKPDFRLGGCY
jgi:hypothetical protein